MESSNPLPLPLVSDGSSSSGSASRPTESAAGTTPAAGGAPTTDLAHFQNLLVLAMRDPRVRAAVLPGPSTPTGHGKYIISIHLCMLATVVHAATKNPFLTNSHKHDRKARDLTAVRDSTRLPRTQKYPPKA